MSQHDLRSGDAFHRTVVSQNNNSNAETLHDIGNSQVKMSRSRWMLTLNIQTKISKTHKMTSITSQRLSHSLPRGSGGAIVVIGRIAKLMHIADIADTYHAVIVDGIRHHVEQKRFLILQTRTYKEDTGRWICLH